MKCLVRDLHFARLPKILRDRLQTTYNSHILHSPNADPFKVALFKLIGRLDPNRRAVRRATNTAEDWIWFQLAMVDEDEGNGLRELGKVLEGYGEKHFEGGGGAKKGMWARVLMVCGLFEQVCLAKFQPEVVTNSCFRLLQRCTNILIIGLKLFISRLP